MCKWVAKMLSMFSSVGHVRLCSLQVVKASRSFGCDGVESNTTTCPAYGQISGSPQLGVPFN